MSEIVVAEIIDGLSLPELASEANRFHAEAETKAQSAVESAWLAGKALIAAKEQCKHGDWLPWLDANFDADERTARRYMVLASNRTCVSDLDPGTSINGALAAIQKENGRNEPDPVKDPVVPKPGTYSCIVIDPPWDIKKIERDERPNQGAFLDYPTMSLDQIADEKWVPVRTHAADDCHLYLWVTHKYLPAGLELMEAWGFRYQCLMTWRKNVGITPFSWMYDTEHVIFGRKGNLPLTQLGLRLSFDAPVQGHSVKPEVFYERVRAASPGPRIDMFARTERNGFEVWGNEVSSGL
ncbi:MT-A70 family methyltransferase [Mycolicibacterium sp.]|uniref:MT-A70 family methyltransferase n=1 Tax=Mycolicibacterium sp. TaxID=2320850 RepID=UPI0028ACC85A|nr:MT-A70 family methyltransferase [Mycolicibacterium sp.]